MEGIVPKIKNLVDKKQLIIHKIRGQKESGDEENGIIRRPYVEIIINKRYLEKVYNGLEGLFVLIIRNYKDKNLYDNLNTLKNIRLKDDTIPKTIMNPFNVKFYKPYGQYGLLISYKINPTTSVKELADDLSFYDTKDLRDMEAETKEFENAVSILVMCKKKNHKIQHIFENLEKCV
jgi:hypothetical protein